MKGINGYRKVNQKHSHAEKNERKICFYGELSVWSLVTTVFLSFRGKEPRAKCRRMGTLV